MVWVLSACLLAILATTAFHDQVLWWLNSKLPKQRMTSRVRLLVVMLGVFAAHALEISLYGLAIYTLIHAANTGTLGGATLDSLGTCLYFSAETFSSLGYGDFVPRGPLRLLAGVETLNGLLLIGWSASFAYVTMERYWGTHQEARLHLFSTGSFSIAPNRVADAEERLVQVIGAVADGQVQVRDIATGTTSTCHAKSLRCAVIVQDVGIPNHRGI